MELPNQIFELHLSCSMQLSYILYNLKLSNQKFKANLSSLFAIYILSWCVLQLSKQTIDRYLHLSLSDFDPTLMATFITVNLENFDLSTPILPRSANLNSVIVSFEFLTNLQYFLLFLLNYYTENIPTIIFNLHLKVDCGFLSFTNVNFWSLQSWMF